MSVCGPPGGLRWLDSLEGRGGRHKWCVCNGRSLGGSRDIVKSLSDRLKYVLEFGFELLLH